MHLMTMNAQTTYTPSIQQRYRRLAGPFRESESGTLDRLLAYLQATGARIVTVGEPDGLNVWRLRSECESIDETRRRLGRYA